MSLWLLKVPHYMANDWLTQLNSATNANTKSATNGSGSGKTEKVATVAQIHVQTIGNEQTIKLITKDNHHSDSSKKNNNNSTNNNNANNGTIPKDMEFRIQTRPTRKMVVFKEKDNPVGAAASSSSATSSSSSSTSSSAATPPDTTKPTSILKMIGDVDVVADVKAVLDTKYSSHLRNRLQTAVFDKMASERMEERKDIALTPNVLREIERRKRKDTDREKEATVKPKEKRVRSERMDVEQMVLEAFSRPNITYMSLKELEDYTSQPRSWLLEIVNDLCVREVRGEQTNKYRLQDAYRGQQEK